MAYLKMASWKYYSLTLFLYAGCILGAIFVEDIGVIFEFVGAFGLTITSFMLPSVMYLIILRNEKAFLELESNKQRFWNKFGAIFMICLSIVNMILVIVKQIVPGKEEESTE